MLNQGNLSFDPVFNIVLGTMGTGKSYLMMYQLYNYIKSKDTTYKRVITNLTYNKDKLTELIEKSGKEFEVEKLNLTEIYNYFEFIIEKYNLYFNNKQMHTDEAEEHLINSIKNHHKFSKYFGAWIILDEAGLSKFGFQYNSKTDNYLPQAIRYIRHLHTRLDLISQSLQDFPNDIKSVCQSFIIGNPLASAFNIGTFTYVRFLDPAKKVMDGVFKIKKQQDIFNLYVSGANIKRKNIYMKYVYIILVLLFILVLLIFRAQSNGGVMGVKNTEHVENNLTQQKEYVDDNISNIVINDKYANEEFVYLKCYIYKPYINCFNDDYEYSSTEEKMVKLVKDELDIELSKELDDKEIYIKFPLSFVKTFFMKTIKKDKHEKDNDRMGLAI